jgi:hypothetical protein
LLFVPWGEINEEAIIPIDDPWSELFELCYIPVLGGGFGFPLSDVQKMPVSLRQKAVKWLSERRELEHKALNKRTGGGGGGASYDPDGPSMHTPSPPRRR